MRLWLRSLRTVAALATLVAAVGALACGSEPRPREEGGTTGTTGVVRDPKTLVRVEGDQRFFQPPSDLKPGEVVCKSNGLRLVTEAAAPVNRSDEGMREVGRCEELDIPLFSPDGEGSTAATLERVYVKTSPGYYLRLRAEVER
jgi:hypothetical protein